jgi:rhodanese-related sulfurtransferase
VTPPAGRRTVDEVLAEARSRLKRLDPLEAAAAAADGAVLVDTRPASLRAADGEIPGALEWRLDPASPARLPVASYGLQVIVVCDEGYASSLAAVSLQDLGLRGATDLAGGFQAWRQAGLPVTSGDHDRA